MRRLSLGLWLLLAGCAEDTDALTAPLAEPALLESSGNEYRCQLEQPIARWYDSRWQGGSLIRDGDHWAVFNGQSLHNSWESEEHAILVRTVDAQGTPGLPRSLVRATITSRVNGVAQAGGKTALVWSGVDIDQGNQYRNQLVVLGEGAEPLGPSRAVGPNAADFVASVQSNAARIAAADGGWALLVTSRQSEHVIFSRVNDAGEPLGEPRDIMRTQGDFIASSLVRFGGGYAATWATIAEAYLVLLDAHGEPTAGPWSIGTYTRGQALLARGDELLLVYTLSEPGAGSLRLARFDRSGHISGVHDVQPPGFGRRVEDPALANFGDDIALMWSEGTPIGNCGGCVLDNTLKLVVLGGTDELPKSGVVELTNPIAKAALMRPQLGTDSERLLIVANMEWHVPMDGASAVVRCTR